MTLAFMVSQLKEIQHLLLSNQASLLRHGFPPRFVIYLVPVLYDVFHTFPNKVCRNISSFFRTFYSGFFVNLDSPAMFIVFGFSSSCDNIRNISCSPLEFSGFRSLRICTNNSKKSFC